MVGIDKMVPTSLRSPSTMSPMKCRNPWGRSGGRSSASSISSPLRWVTVPRSAVPTLGSFNLQSMKATMSPGTIETKKARRQPLPT